jgi:3-hydroxyacyl-[acyl-carrier-protein] dehydratase
VRFILLDRILELHPGQRITAVKTFAPEEELFRDHFPGFPVVPGVLLTETMAQAAGKCLDMEDTTRGKPMLVRITNANFREWVRPGQTITAFACIRSSRPQYAIADCQASVDGRTVASAELFFSFAPRSHFVDCPDDVLTEYLSRAASAPSGPQTA